MDKRKDSPVGSSDDNETASYSHSQPSSLAKTASGSTKMNSEESKKKNDNKKVKDEVWKEQIRKAVEESRRLAKLQTEAGTQTSKYAQVRIAPPRITKSYYDRLRDQEFYRVRRARPTRPKSFAAFPRFSAYGEIIKDDEDEDEDEDHDDDEAVVGPAPGPTSPYPSSTNRFPKSPQQKRKRKKKAKILEDDEHRAKAAASNLSVDEGGNVLSYFDPRFVKPEFLPLLTKSRNIVVGPPSEILRKYFGYEEDDDLPEEFQLDDTPKAFVLPKKFWKDYDDVSKEAAPVKTLPLLHDTSSKLLAAKKKHEEEKQKKRFEPDQETIKDMLEDNSRPDGIIPRQPPHFGVEYLARQPFKKYAMKGENLNDASPNMMEHWEMKHLNVDPGGQLHRETADRRFKISEVTGTPVKIGKKEGKLTDDKRPWYDDAWAEGFDPEMLNKNPDFRGRAPPPGTGRGRGGPRDFGDRSDDRGDGPRRDRRGERGPADGYPGDGGYESDGSGYSCTCGSYSDESSSESSSTSSESEDGGDDKEAIKRKGDGKKGKKGKKHGKKKSKDSDESSGDGGDKKRKKHRRRKKSKDSDEDKDDGKGKERKKSKDGDENDEDDTGRKKSIDKKDTGTDAHPEPVPAWAPDAWKSPEGFRGWFFKQNKGRKGSISTPDLPKGHDHAKDRDWIRAYYLMKRAKDAKAVDEIREIIGDSDSAKEFLKSLEDEWKAQQAEDPMQRLPREIMPTPRQYPEHVQPAHFEYYKSFPLYPTISNERYFEWFKDVDRLENPKKKRQRGRPVGLSKSANNINWDDPKEAAKWYSYGYRRPDTRPKPERPDYDTRDFIYDNARSIILMPPRKGIPRYIDDRKGTTHLLEPSGLVKRFIFRNDYGEMPEYLVERNEELGRPPVPDMDKFYRPHRCKYLHGHIHCKICMRAHPTVKHRKIKWDCELNPCDYREAISKREKYVGRKEPGHFAYTQPDYSDHFDINQLIQRLAQNNQEGFDQGRHQNFFEYFKDDSRSNNCFNYNSPPVYV